MAPLIKKGYHLYVDNCYTTEKLACYLLKHGNLMCGTAMPRTIKHPPSMKKDSLAQGEFTFQRDGNILLMVRFQGKKKIFFLSTIHNAET